MNVTTMIVSAALAGCMAGAAFAQNPVPLATAGLVSPDVHADRTVTFRIQAPKASQVEIAGEWMSTNRAETTVSGSVMTKDDKGVWSTTVGPLEPNTYTYSFNVDGMNIADPVNPVMKLRARTSASMVTIPGDQPWEYRDVPHGNVEITTTSRKCSGALSVKSSSTRRRATTRTRRFVTRCCICSMAVEG
jgi:enterochelin esterase family protein